MVGEEGVSIRARLAAMLEAAVARKRDADDQLVLAERRARAARAAIANANRVKDLRPARAELTRLETAARRIR